jgi:hypothetical protein
LGPLTLPVAFGSTSKIDRSLIGEYRGADEDHGLDGGLWIVQIPNEGDLQAIAAARLPDP